jgi:hypothetical protein
MEEDESPGEIRTPTSGDEARATSRPPRWNLNMKVRRRHLFKELHEHVSSLVHFYALADGKLRRLLELCSPRGVTSTETDETELEDLVNEEYKIG